MSPLWICTCSDLTMNRPEDKCKYCGRQMVDDRIVAICSKCNKEVDKLMGPSVPHLCSHCLEEKEK